MRAWSWVLMVMLLGAVACVRLVGAPNAGGRATGSTCAAPADCVTGICADGVCCAESCGGARACNLTRSPGTCLPREAGDPCQPDDPDSCGVLSCVTEGNASVCCNGPCQSPLSSCHTRAAPGQCVSRTPGDGCVMDSNCPAGDDGVGHCVDGVCCNLACDGLCRSCNQAGHPGTCTLVDDNTDPGTPSECEGPCTACFGGVCLPALGGTDPKAACPSGLVCGNNATCGVPAGGGCDVNNPCAEGACLLGTCLRFAVEPLPFLGIGANADEVIPVGIALAETGESTLLWLESRDVGLGLSNQLGLARAVGAGWRTHVLRAGSGEGPVALVGIGSYAMAIVAPGTTLLGCNDVPELCQVVGRWIQPDGELGTSEVVWEPPITDDDGDGIFSSTAGPICAVHAQSTADSRVLLMMALGTPGYRCSGAASVWNIHLAERLSSGVWHNPLQDGIPGDVVVSDTFGLVNVALLGGAYVIVDVTRDDRLRATLVRPGEAPQEAFLTEGCTDVRSATAANESGWDPNASFLWVGGACSSPARGFLARLTWENGQLGWSAAVFPPAVDPNSADVRTLVPMGGAGRDLVRLAQLYPSGYLNYGTYVSGVFSREIVPITEYLNPVLVTTPLVGSSALGEHVFFASLYDQRGSTPVARYPFAVRVRE